MLVYRSPWRSHYI